MEDMDCDYDVFEEMNDEHDSINNDDQTQRGIDFSLL